MKTSSLTAVLSDIHGNRLALEAVLEDIKRRGISRIVNLGDSVYGPLDPAGTARILMEMGIPSVSGNEDRIVLAPPGGTHNSPSLGFTRDSLSAKHLRWLASLKMNLVAYNDFFMFHASPQIDDRYFLYEVFPDRVIPRNADRLSAELSDIKQPVILCGHDHLPRTVILPDERLVVNPGSVGLQAFTDDSPFPHKMETGSPHARYAIIWKAGRNWGVENRAVSYDWERASAMAEANGRPDWALWLKSGRTGK